MLSLMSHLAEEESVDLVENRALAVTGYESIDGSLTAGSVEVTL